MLLLARDTAGLTGREIVHRIEPPFLLRMYGATLADYERISDEDVRCEFLDGVLIVHSPASPEHEDRTAFLMTLLNIVASERRLGRVYGSNIVMRIGKRQFCGDVVFVSKPHAKRVRQGRIVGPADLIVEILSESTRSYDLGEKRDAYHAGRAPEIWFIDVRRREWHVECLSGRSYRCQTFSKGRFQSRALPGLVINVEWLWSEPLPSPVECAKWANIRVRSPRRHSPRARPRIG